MRKKVTPDMLEAFRLMVRNMVITHEVTHTIEYKPRPRPTMIYMEISNGAGELWRVAPIQITGQFITPVNLPIEWLTGRQEDRSIPQPQIRLRLEY